MSLSQTNMYLTVASPFGSDVLLLKSLEGEEKISTPFHYRLSFLAESESLSFTTIVGVGVTITILIEDPFSDKKKYIHGIVTSFRQGGTDARLTQYYAEIRPGFWLLSQNRDSRIYQNKSVPDIIAAVFGDKGYTDYKLSLSGTYNPREYCVQYEESDFNFVSRLMEDEGIFYFFEHIDGKHTMVIADATSAHVALSNTSEISYNPHYGQWDQNIIYDCWIEQKLTSTGSILKDYFFETPSTDLTAQQNQTETKKNIYEFHNNYTVKAQGDAKGKLRVDEYKWPAKQLHGQGSCRDMVTGYKFTLADHPRSDANADYVIESLRIDATQDRFYCTFSSFLSTATYRPPRVTPRPRILSAQTALVTGKSGEEIWTDSYGRVKVYFYWDRYGTQDENSSCWIRVNQGWSGKKWGAIFIPRMGMEVIVSFINGDPDKPLVTGAVYNAEQTVPYTLPTDQTKSTIKTNSSKQATGYNELRFEDKKAEEEIYVHAQKDMNTVVENDQTNKILHDQTDTITNHRTTTVSEGNETLTVSKGNRSLDVATGNETHHVKGTRDLTVEGNETHTNKIDFTQTVTGNYKLTIDGTLTVEVKGAISIKSTTDSITIDASQNLNTKSGQNTKNEAGMNFDNKAGMNLTNDAGMKMVNKAALQMENKSLAITSSADGMHEVKAGGILTLKGTLIKVN